MEIIKFYSKTCVPCRMMNPLIDKLEKEEGIKITPVDIDISHDLVVKYGVRSVPTFILLKDGKEVKYPDMRLYQEIIFLNHWFKGKWVVENVKSYYKPLIPFLNSL
jgi:thiol-disulfide isomerase/thioredoxin